MLVRRVLSVFGAALLACTAGAGLQSDRAEAQILNLGPGGGAAGRWFVEGNIGAGWGDFDGFSLAGVSGGSGDSGDASVAGGVGLGFYFSNQLYAKVSYKYFGSFDAVSSIAGLGGALDARAHGLMFGLGFNLDLSRELFLEATAEIGASFINASGSFAGVSLGSGTETNLAAGLGLGLGYRLSRDVDLLVMGNYHWLGDAATDGGLRANDLTVITATVGARLKF
jgi:opacity protein-like surface antigen